MTPAAKVSRQTVVHEALEMIRTDGVGAVTMRGLAARLSIQAPSLYEHVRNKEELLELVAKEAFEDFQDFPGALADVTSIDEWIDVVTQGCIEMRAFHLAHPGLATLLQRTLDPDRDRIEGSRADLNRAQLSALVRLGVPESVARPMFDAVSFWTRSAVASEDAAMGGHSIQYRDQLFLQGLGILLDGMRTELKAAIR